MVARPARGQRRDRRSCYRAAVTPETVVDRARAPDGGMLVLHRRGDEFTIRVDGKELMSSRTHHSEEELARQAVRRIGERAAPRLLVGGLGLGYTTRAALDALPPRAQVVVAELVPAVVAWNRGPLAHLARRPLDDPRVRIETIDVGRLLSTTTVRFDGVLLDVDNGPQGLTRRANQLLYTDSGLALARRALRPGGLLAVWSASPDPPFERRLRKAGFEVETVAESARGSAGGRVHTLFFGRIPGPQLRPKGRE